MAHKLFLGGISPNTTTEAIQSHFEKYGAIVDAVVMYKDGKHRGFGFVTFDNPDSMHQALSEEQVIDGRPVDVKEAVPQGEAPPPRGGPNGAGGFGGGGGSASPSSRSGGPACDKVFIGGLAQTTTESMVRDYFSQYGNIIDCVVMKDRGSNRSRGFGFVQYDSTDPVEQVMVEYHNHQIDGKWVEVKKAVPQDRMAPPPSRGPSVVRPPIGAKGYGNPRPSWQGYGAPALTASPTYGADRHYGGHPGAYGPYGGGYAYGGYGAYGGYAPYQMPGASGGGYGPVRSPYRPRPY